jgi:hypothetical protein
LGKRNANLKTASEPVRMQFSGFSSRLSRPISFARLMHGYEVGTLHVPHPPGIDRMLSFPAFYWQRQYASNADTLIPAACGEFQP